MVLNFIKFYYCYHTYLYEGGFSISKFDNNNFDKLFKILLFLTTLTLEVFIILSFLFFYSDCNILLLIFSLFSFQFLIFKVLFLKDDYNF